MASTFTPEQIIAFLNLIRLPQKFYPSQNPPLDLAFLTALHVHTISTIPYENLALHYSATKKFSIKPQDAYIKFVEWGRGRGGYCMEISIFMNHILRGLGFDAYTAGVRIRLRENGEPVGDFTGWRHIVNIVTLPTGSRYMVDVAYGGDGAIQPMPMISGHIIQNLGLQEIRLIHDHIPYQVHRTPHSKLWIYQTRNSPDKAWKSFHAFPELEFLQNDFEVMHWYTGSSPESFQTYQPTVVKFLRRQRSGSGGVEGDVEIYGKRMLVNGLVKENLGGRTLVVQECKTEVERVEALEKWFGIRLTEEEREEIKGYRTELK